MYFKTFPGVKTYIDQTHAATKLNKYVLSPLGHARRFYGAKDEFKGTASFNASLRGSQNYIIQSATSCVGAVVFAQINREIKAIGGVCTATIHDALSSEVPIDKAQQAVEIFQYYMNEWPQTHWDWLGLSIGSECDVGLDWKRYETIKPGIKQAEIEALLDKLRELP